MGDDKKPAPSDPQAAAGEMPVYYVKSNFYRVVHADGIYGGGTPTPGDIMMSVFSHRIPLPEKIVNDADGNEILAKRVVKYGIENELEVSLAMSLEMAKIMRNWLDKAIKNAEVAVAKGGQPNQTK